MKWWSWTWVRDVCIVLDYLGLDWSRENSLVIFYAIPFIFLKLGLVLCWYWYAPRMVVVLCALLVNCVVSSIFLCKLWISLSCCHYLIYYDGLSSLFNVSMIISIYLWVTVKYVNLLLTSGYNFKLWLCPYVCTFRVDAWLFLIRYMSLVMILLMILW